MGMGMGMGSAGNPWRCQCVATTNGNAIRTFSYQLGNNVPLPTQVILTPHIGWQRIESRQRLVDAVAENIGAFVRGGPVNIVG